VKLLLDSCVWSGARTELTAAGHETIWAGDWPNDPGDEEILARAHDEGRILVTLDKDFGDLAVSQAKAHRGIIRLVNIAARRQSLLCAYVLERHSEDLLRGAIVTVEAGRLRVRMP